ncbi:putative dolichyl pyrophosphate Man9GlcNAc2 alpha-1,3-glucosyltransferase [Neolecta irregularis DAH-3]|uniref:Alpha-1,3-glucosyltransferase n=1 Tax=Neolecta irregularis (strain DAH-3) TaxID=1198029 RepID=A0A1U7LV13_NEOID|nr:putative dolichyl pyrophosphate Man9GlcNAc2 alpha-1,3-glucosyltransferase [Neolecta irregularis DAH-3]|eukprot:OLL26516.1 putative dolichyl pyrophosphate Man9GlcNAc2 alpha-1,3-glucosyltransferase [Neolecta irregularis DAH-3]
MPTCLMLFMYPRKQLLPLGLGMSALGFYLVGFQVHEKSILLPLMPVTMLITEGNLDSTSWIGWINNIAMFSMWPLLKREGLGLQYSVIIGFWNWLCGMYKLSTNRMGRTLQMLSYLAILSIHLLDAAFPQSLRWPDLWVVANVVVSCGCFGIFFVWGNVQLFIQVRKKQKEG